MGKPNFSEEFKRDAVEQIVVRCQRRIKILPLGRSKSRPVWGAPWYVLPSNSKHVPRRVGL